MKPGAGIRLIVSAAILWGHAVSGAEIHDTAENGDLARVKVLIESNPKLLFKRDYEGFTPLHSAVHGGHMDVTEYLLSKGAKVDTRADFGMTPLDWADSVEIARVLVANHADVNARARGMDNETALHLAAYRNDIAMVEFLLDRGADINAVDRTGATPLIEASEQSGKAPLLELLVARGADLKVKDKTGNSPLHYAAWWNNLSAIRFLLSRKVDVNARGRKGYRPLQVAGMYGSEDAARLLLANGAQVDARDDAGNTALFMAASDDDMTMINILLAHGADVNARNHRGRTALGMAVKWKKTNAVALLRKSGGRE